MIQYTYLDLLHIKHVFQFNKLTNQLQWYAFWAENFTPVSVKKINRTAMLYINIYTRIINVILL